MTTNGKPLPPPLPPKRNGNGSPAVQADPNRFAVTTGVSSGAHRVILFGPGGAGKTTLAALAPNPIILDIEDGSRYLNVPRISGLRNYQDVRDCLHSPVLDSFGTIIIDSATKFEDMAVENVLETVPKEDGYTAKNIEDYGWGKGFSHIYDKSLLLLQDLDAHVRAGRHVIIIAHICTEMVPNPAGEDFGRYEPRIQSPKSGKSSVRNRMWEWADHVVFLTFDVATKKGKAQGGDSRTIYTRPAASHIAKSRTVSVVMPFVDATDGTLWPTLFNVNNGGNE